MDMDMDASSRKIVPLTLSGGMSELLRRGMGSTPRRQIGRYSPGGGLSTAVGGEVSRPEEGDAGHGRGNRRNDLPAGPRSPLAGRRNAQENSHCFGACDRTPPSFFDPRVPTLVQYFSVK